MEKEQILNILDNFEQLEELILDTAKRYFKITFASYLLRGPEVEWDECDSESIRINYDHSTCSCCSVPNIM